MLTVRDWDAGIAHVLTGQSTYAYERREIGGVVQYIISLGDVELGHFSITPGPEPWITLKTEDAARREPAYNQGLVALWQWIEDGVHFRWHTGPWADKPAVMALAPGKGDAGDTCSPLPRTRQVAEMARDIKAQSVHYNQRRVASAIQHMVQQDPLAYPLLKGKTITECTVRNAYRAMGWQWERGDAYKR